MKISSFKYLVSQGIVNFWKNKMMSFASFCIIMVSLLLVGFSALFIVNINSLITSTENLNEVLVYVVEDASNTEIEAIKTKLESMDNLSDVVFYSKEDAYEDMKEKYKEHEDLFEYVGESPLLDSYKLKVREVSQMDITVKEISSINNIDTVQAPLEFASTLTNLRTIFTLISGIVMVALVVICMVIISNTTRSSVFARRKEISIMKYVGATNVFIRIPFFVEGMFTGVLAGVVATVITAFGYSSMANSLNKDLSLYKVIGSEGVIPFEEIGLIVAGAYIISSALIGAFGCMISMRKHLKV